MKTSGKQGGSTAALRIARTAFSDELARQGRRISTTLSGQTVAHRAMTRFLDEEISSRMEGAIEAAQTVSEQGAEAIHRAYAGWMTDAGIAAAQRMILEHHVVKIVDTEDDDV